MRGEAATERRWDDGRLTLAARLDRIEKLVRQRIPQADPIAQITHYAAVFVTGFIVAKGAGAMLHRRVGSVCL